MRQHLLRLLIVLILVVGIGVIVFSALKDNTPFNIAEYVNSENKKDSEIEENLVDLNSLVNSSFSEKVVINNFYKSSLNYLSSLLNNQKLSKQEVSIIKNNYRDYRTQMNLLNNSMVSLKSYMQDSELNSSELEGRKESVNENFSNVLLEKNKILNTFKNLVNSKIYNGKNNDAKIVLINTNNIIVKNYLTNDNVSFSLLNNVMSKTQDLINSNGLVVDDIVKFVIKFNEMGEEIVIQVFENYFETSFISENLSLILNYLNSEVYYEKN